MKARDGGGTTPSKASPSFSEVPKTIQKPGGTVSEWRLDCVEKDVGGASRLLIQAQKIKTQNGYCKHLRTECLRAGPEEEVPWYPGSDRQVLWRG